MGISVFPSGGGGEFITNDFVVDMNNTDNNVIDLGRSYSEGSYDVSLASGDTSFDIYAISAEGDSVGYTNNATLIATEPFTVLAILGVSTTEKITFSFSGASNNASSEGDAPGAGAYLESINPSDLPNIDDTANVIGGNFATDVEFFFESGTVSLPAKNITQSDSTALIVTRPDNFDPALDPWDVRVNNPGVTPPTGSNAHILAGTVDAGATPVWTTSSPLPLLTLNQSYLATVVATDPDGQTVNYSVTSGSLPTGLSLNGSTGEISGTATTTPTTFEITASDGAGGANPRSFDFAFQKASGGSVTESSGFFIHTFNSSDDFVIIQEIPELQYLVIGGGGAGGSNNSRTSGGGGAGGYRSSVPGEQSGSATTAETPLSSLAVGTVAVTVGVGGAVTNSTGGNGSASSFGTFVSTVGGGGGGGNSGSQGQAGGSGGGGAQDASAGAGTSQEGFSGTNGSFNLGAGGGGGASSTAAQSSDPDGGLGIDSAITGTSVGRAGGGGGGGSGNNANSGFDGGGDGGSTNNSPNAGLNGTGGGGGGKGRSDFGASGTGAAGGNGVVIVRYAI